MKPIFRMAFLGVWGVALTAAGTTAPEYPQEDQTKVLQVRDAVKLLEQYLVDRPADGEAWYGLGAVHTAAYVNGIDAVEIVLPAEGQEAAPQVQLGVPPLTYAKRLESVSKLRAEHLAEAVRAFQNALDCDGGNTDRHSLALGFTLYECRDRFTRNPWPLKGRAFDGEAKDFGAESRWWEDQALAVFRQMGVAAPSEERADKYSGGNEAREDAAWLMLQVLESRHPRSELDSKELAMLSLSARPAGILRMTEALKKALPPQPQELTSLYPLTSTSTATAQYYLRAQDASLKFGLAFGDIPIVGLESEEPYHNKPVAPEMLVRIAAFLRYHEETFRLLKEAAQSPACRYPVDLTEGPGMELPHLVPLRNLARLLALKTLWAAETGDQAIAASAVVECLRLGASVRQEPLVSSQSVYLSILSMAVEALNDAQNRVGFFTTYSDEMQDVLLAMEGYEGLFLAIKGEYYSSLRFAREFDIASVERMGVEPDEWARIKGEFASESELHAAFPAFLGAAKLPYQQTHAEFLRISADQRSPISMMPQFLSAFTRAQAQLRCARVALAVGDFAQLHDVPPESLDALVPDFLASVPLDPFDEQPLRYRRAGDGFQVYSVGLNLNDDGGVEKFLSRSGLANFGDVGYSVGMSVDETAEE